MPNAASDDERNPEIAETKTSIDSLLDLLRARGKSELNQVAISLNIDPRIIENWAKVLEAGNLIKISYEVGRMYLEPVTLGVEATADVKAKTEVKKFILEEDLAVEKISLEKFSKSIDELNSTIGGVERLYQQKMPDVQRVLSDIDRSYAPINARMKEMDKMRDDADKKLDEMNKNIDALNLKLGSFSTAQTESSVSSRLEKLNSILASMADANNSITELGKTKAKTMATLQTELDAQVKDLKQQLNTSSYNIDQALKSNARQLAEMNKSLQDQIAAARLLSREVGAFKKEFDGSRHDLDALKTSFTDRYEKIRQDMIKGMKSIESQSKDVEQSIKDIKSSLGEVSNLDADIRRWKKNMSDINKEINDTRNELINLTNGINALNANKGMSVERRAKAMEDISKGEKKNKERVNKIKKIIKDTSEEIGSRAEGKE